jgi:hypothetical protein
MKLHEYYIYYIYYICYMVKNNLGLSSQK